MIIKIGKQQHGWEANNKPLITHYIKIGRFEIHYYNGTKITLSFNWNKKCLI